MDNGTIPNPRPSKWLLLSHILLTHLKHFAETANSKLDGEALVFNGLHGLVLIRRIELDVADGHDVIAGKQHPRLASRTFWDDVLDEDACCGAMNFIVHFAANDGDSKTLGVLLDYCHLSLGTP